MLRNYFKIAIRNFRKHAAYSIINITGLTLGLASCFIIFQFVAFEYSFDTFNKNKDSLYRVTTVILEPEEEPGNSPETSFGLAPAMTDAIPEIKYAARLHPEYSPAIVSNPLNPDRVFEEEDIYYADPSFLKMFTYSIKSGRRENLLESGTMLLSESAAQKYFGTENAIGQVLNITGEIDKSYKITGIFSNVPANSHLKFNMLLPMDDLLKGETYGSGPGSDGWSWNNFVTYIQLQRNADPNVVNKKMTDVFTSIRGEWLRQNGMKGSIELQPLMDIHLNDKIIGPKTIMGSYRTVYFFSIIGLITLLIALINYVNLATARSIDRSREVGVRKVIGARRKQLIIQFLSESALINMVAAVTALVIVELFTPLVNSIAEREFAGLMNMNPVLWFSFFATFSACTLMAGLYPAFMLSSFKPVAVLKGKTGSFKTQLWLRRGLVVVQFTAAVVLIGGTAIVYDQLNYMREINLGLNLEKIVTVNGPRVFAQGADHEAATLLFIQELKKLPAVKEAATSWSLPGQGFNWNGASVRKASDLPSEAIRGVCTYIDTGFINLYQLELIAGNGFTNISAVSDSNAPWQVLANETAVRSLGYSSPVDAIGKPIDIGGYDTRIAGVLKDFNWSSAHIARQNIFFGQTTAGGHISLKLNTDDLPAALNSVQSVFEKLFPGNVFSYAFVDEKFNEQYKTDQRFASLFTVFAGLAILIACLGLFGLAAFTTRQRTKEIGIRKVLGASVTEIIIMLSKDFFVLVLTAIIIASPAVYLLMKSWLQDFAYHITIGPEVFFITAIIVVAVALITVSYQSIRAAHLNPVNSLKYE